MAPVVDAALDADADAVVVAPVVVAPLPDAVVVPVVDAVVVAVDDVEVVSSPWSSLALRGALLVAVCRGLLIVVVRTTGQVQADVRRGSRDDPLDGVGQMTVAAAAIPVDQIVAAMMTAAASLGSAPR